jgi:glutaminase
MPRGCGRQRVRRTGEQVTSAVACRCALAVMASAGLCETSGDWLYEVGVPAKSGIGGGIVTVARQSNSANR